MKSLDTWMHPSRLLSLLIVVLMYGLGTGIVRYLGYSLNWLVFFIGLAALLMLVASSFFLSDYFAIPVEQARRDADIAARRQSLLLAAITTLTVGAVLTVLLYSLKVMSLSVFLLLGIAFLLAYFYAVPPFRLADRGYGELAYAMLVTNLTPALAFLFQTSNFHRLLAMLTFPMTAFYLAMLLALSLPGYAEDLKNDQGTMMVTLGWQRGMNFHNWLILAGYLLLVLDVVLGLPWGLVWPALLTVPLGGFQIWLFVQITAGAKPNWRLITILAAAIVIVTGYLLTLSLWTV
jgi:1,4-dihydroxy-2-naphthoate octaprenyltransferase